MTAEGNMQGGSTSADKPSGVRDVKSASRTVELLEILANQTEPVRLREISEALGAPRSSVYALLRTLVQRGWVRTDASGTLYGIGIRALLTGTSYLDADPWLRLVQSWLDWLKSELDETVHFGRLDGTDIVYLATRESSQYLRNVNRVGRRLPAHATALGKVLLAERTAVELDSILPGVLPQLTPQTITDRAALEADLEITRRRGYAVDEGENLQGVRCFGFALHLDTTPRDAISCSVPTERLDEARTEFIVGRMRHVQAEIENAAFRYEAPAGVGRLLN
jgi:DNA-binding IclR family transcriptional regulator